MTTDDRREQYERTMSGGFRLAWINQGDSENMLAQVESVASGKTSRKVDRRVAARTLRMPVNDSTNAVRRQGR